MLHVLSDHQAEVYSHIVTMSISALICVLRCNFSVSLCLFSLYLFYYYFILILFLLSDIILFLLLSLKNRLQGGVTCCPSLCLGLQAIACQYIKSLASF